MTTRNFPICKDHVHADWNQPDIDDVDCVLCRLFYLEAQEGLLEEWQQRAIRAEDAIKEIQRPLDEQMARLNETVTQLNGENERLRRMQSETERKPCTIALSAIAAEPELPGEMPDEMWDVMNSGDRDAVTEAMRIAVRQTKEGIRERYLAAFANR